MIPFDFEYYRSDTIQEAVKIFHKVRNEGKIVIFYSGGTEFITFSRLNTITADAVIDVKGIAECNVLEFQDEQLVVGAAVSLNKISESNFFPLLGQAVKKIADHTSRNKITIGGNMKSRLIYRESVLALLLVDAKVKIAGEKGERIVPLADVYEEELKLTTGEFLVQILIDKTYINLPFVSLKKTKMSKVGYPIVSVAAIVKDRNLRAAISGVCEFPFRSAELETALNDFTLKKAERVDKAVSLLPTAIINDQLASAEYRKFVLKNTLSEAIDVLEVAQA
ncbi:MAG TPA: xanthine dehydrogenase [Bacillus bacterium]|nr:xanthine dehydrogenase [Bacillus sp. (in: firmicutes)]